MSAEKPTVIQTEDGVISECCGSDLNVQRAVHDVVSYHPERLEDDTLFVSYSKVYEGESDGYEVTCSQCGKTLDIEVEER